MSPSSLVVVVSIVVVIAAVVVVNSSIMLRPLVWPGKSLESAQLVLCNYSLYLTKPVQTGPVNGENEIVPEVRSAHALYGTIETN